MSIFSSIAASYFISVIIRCILLCMKLTKYEHACFTVEKDGQVLVIDPGNLSDDFVTPENVVAVVITHQHPDHFDAEKLAAIFAKNNAVLVLGPTDVIDKVEIENKKAVSPGEKLSVGPFDLEFFGGVHTEIHSSIPRCQNVGMMINGLLYYPGDSLNAPDRPVDVLALPAAAPWLKISEAMDFLTAARPRLAFPTHDAILSDKGHELVDRLLGSTGERIGAEYTRLNAPLEI